MLKIVSEKKDTFSKETGGVVKDGKPDRANMTEYHKLWNEALKEVKGGVTKTGGTEQKEGVAQTTLEIAKLKSKKKYKKKRSKKRSKKKRSKKKRTKKKSRKY